MKYLLCLAAFALPQTAMAAVGAADIAAHRDLAAQDIRLASIGYRLVSANAPFCSRKAYNPGWVVHDLIQYPDPAIAKAAFGFATPLAIAAVVPGGPADKAGIRGGDGILAVKYQVQGFEWAPSDGKGYERVAAFKQIMNDGWVSQNLPAITLQRDAKDFESSFEPPLVCASDFQVDTTGKVNAGANLKMVSVSYGLMKFAPNDAELAAAVAHEIAHTLLEHPEQLAAMGKKKNAKAIYATEMEADRLSVWLLANAGYDLDVALRFWDRWGRKYDPGFLNDGTHPRWKIRVAAMKQEIALMANTPRVDGLLPPPLLTQKPPQ